MQDKINRFIAAHNNQSIEAEDPSALDACMDELFAWCDFLGIPRSAVRRQFAYQVWENADDETRKYFDLIPNTPTNVSQAGDVLCFKRVNGIVIGHVSVDIGKSDINNAISFDQNWDTLHYFHLDAQGNHIPYCRTVVHAGYYGVIGFLRPKIILQGDDVLLSKIQAVVNGAGDPHSKVTAIKQLVNS